MYLEHKKNSREDTGENIVENISKRKHIYSGRHRGYGKKLAVCTLAGLIAMSVSVQPMVALAGPAGDSISAGSTGGPGSGGSGSSTGAPNTNTASSNTWSGVIGSPSAYRADGTVAGAIARGIDTSYWNQNVNWNQVAADNVQFAMLATRFRGDVDPFFPINAQGAYQNGLKIGAYIYSYATSVEMAEQEADFILNLIKDYPISFPVVFDAEDANSLGTLSPSEVSNVINAFCRKIEAAGYHPMVYANEYWLKNKIDMTTLKYDIWVARYADSYTYSNPAMWQASNTGSVSGVNGNVDINYLFKDFSSVIPANTWRTIGGNRYYYMNHIMQKSAWINDGQNWYYMNAQGNPATGWQTIDGSDYYLDPAGGAMTLGFKELDGAWYYFDANGAMATGWRDVDGARYYMASDGKRQTGWQTIDGSRYYLESSGAMATGWKQLDGAWYCLAGDGKMLTGWQNVGGTWYYMAADGKMQTGWQDIEGSRYYLDASGAMAVGWRDIDGSRYFFNGSGAMTTDWQNLDGAWYYLGGDGKMQTGWQNVGGSMYYLDGSGKMQTGWQTIGGSLYYLDPASGAKAVNTVLDFNGVPYLAGADGICVPVPADALGAESGNAGGSQTENGVPAGNDAQSGNGAQAGNQGQSTGPAGPAS